MIALFTTVSGEPGPGHLPAPNGAPRKRITVARRVLVEARAHRDL